MSTSWPWPVGTIIVCVNGRGWRHPENYSSLPQEGSYYTVRATCHGQTTGPALRLQEITGRWHPDCQVECGFRKFRFRLAESVHDEAVFLNAISITIP